MKVTFIPKAGKADYAVAKAYRPITLSNFVLKGLERIIQWYILDKHVTRPLTLQHAYTKGRSCDSALSHFIDDAEKAVFNSQFLLAVSLDCSGAFDCIKFDAASKSMRVKGIPSQIVCWYDHLLKGRLVSAEIQGLTQYVKPKRGSPQGGVLSPLVWNLIMDGFLSQFKKGPVKALGYADDILLYIQGSNPVIMGELLQPVINSVLWWGKENGLSFNPKKTSMVLFTRRRGFSPPIVTMGGDRLGLNDSFRYLGVEIHRSLSWNKHITARVNKCRGLLFKCKQIISRSWGLTPTKIDWIYKAIVRPKLTYGAVVWGSRLTKNEIAKLVKLQRLALLLMTQPLRSSPTEGLEVMMGWLPLDLHVKEMGLCTYNRIQLRKPKWDYVGTHKVMKGHLGLWNGLLNKLYPDGYPRERRLQRRVWIPKHIHHTSLSKDPINVYTDASKVRETVGLGWLICDEDFILAEASSPFKGINIHRAEVLAISEALSWIKDHGPRERVYRIWCDSQGAVSCLNKHIANDNLMWETLSLLREVCEIVTVRIAWTKGHINTTGNVVADHLARKGADLAEELSYAEPYLPIGIGELKLSLKRDTLLTWQRRWDETDGYKVSKLFKPFVGRSAHIQKLSFGELSLLSQVVTGHGLFKRHLRHWNEIGDINCALCGEDWEYSWHLWEYCPALIIERAQIRGQIKRGLSYEKALLKFFQLPELLELRARNEAIVGS